MHLAATIDLTPLRSHLERAVDLFRNNAVRVAAGAYIDALPKLYAQGIGGDDRTLPAYNSEYATRLGIPTTPKTLSRGKGRLYDLELMQTSTDEGLVTVKEVSETITSKKGKTRTVSSRDIALGQQTGHSGDWSYSNPLFGVNEPIQVTAAHDIALFLQENL